MALLTQWHIQVTWLSHSPLIILYLAQRSTLLIHGGHGKKSIGWRGTYAKIRRPGFW